MPPSAPRVAYWFRTDLRLHDQPALDAALKLKPEVLYPIWTWDPHYIFSARVGPNRWQFLLDCQQDLDKSIRDKTGGNNGLIVLRGNPLTCLEQVLKDWKISHLVFERDTDLYGAKRDKRATDMAESLGVKVISVTGRTLWDPEAMLNENQGKAIYSISAVERCGPNVGKIPRPLEAPKTLPKAGDLKFGLDKDSDVKAHPDMNLIDRKSKNTDKVTCYNEMAGPDGKFSVVTMDEMDIAPATSRHRGGETRALKTLQDYLNDAKKTAEFEKPKTNPGVFNPPETTLLSPHLHFGSLGIRQFYWGVKDVVAKYKGTASKPPASLEGQLLFRDMYFHAQHATSNYDRVEGNEHCHYMAWKLPTTFDKEGNANGYDKSAATNGDETFGKGRISAEEQFVRWSTGHTGFPWIDAIMRQLIRDGWIHHLARHSVACFLTRGQCWISWERGADVFERYLLDHEPACNAGNWQWLSCSAFFTSYFRVYSPVAFGKKWDPSGNLIREFCPELKDVPDKFIYEPWKLSAGDQKKYGVVIGKDYPKPMLDLSVASKTCLEAMKKSYALKIMGNDKRVASGEAREMLQDYTPDPGDVGGDPGAFDWEEEEERLISFEREMSKPEDHGQKRKATHDDSHSKEETARVEGGETKADTKSTGKRTTTAAKEEPEDESKEGQADTDADADKHKSPSKKAKTEESSGARTTRARSRSRK
ncbi:hypothetical protein PYCC9005_002075 [Savitreella phatthalungensis]